MAECLALICSDGKCFEADSVTLTPLRVIGYLRQDVDTRRIPLPAVNGEALSTIMDFSAMDSLDNQRYFALTLACNYLEYRSALGYLLGGLIARFMALDDATFVATIGQPYMDLLLAACLFLPTDQVAAFHRRFMAHFGTDTFSDTFQKPVRAFLASDYRTGFTWASVEGQTALVARLLASPKGPGRGIDPSANGDFAIIAAADNGHTAVVALLLAEPLERGIDPSAGENAPIRFAARNGHVDVVALLLAEPRERGIDPSAVNNEAIRYAAAKGHADVVALLLSQGTGRGIDPSVYDGQAIRAAARNGHTAVVALLLEQWERVLN